MNFKIKAEVLGKFRIEVLKSDGTVKYDSGYFKNLITDSGMDRLASDSAVQYVQVGSGNAAPAFTDTSLQSFISSTNNEVSATSGSLVDQGYCFRTYVWQFAVGAATGNIAEIGVGWAASGSLFSRTLVKDAAGFPTTITVLPDESLRVTWVFCLYWPTADTLSTLVNSGNKGGTYDCISRAANISGWRGLDRFGTITVTAYTNSSLSPITGVPTGTSITGSPTITIEPYVLGSYSKTYRAAFSSSQGVATNGISAIRVTVGGSFGIYQVSYSPAILKTADDYLVLSFTLTWARRP